jgi:3-methyladenine DNA glycosylase Tag
MDMAIPERIEPKSLSDYLSVLSKAVFQAGVSWKLIDSKWPAFCEDFEGFDPERVAAFAQSDVDRLMQDERLLRSRKKIEGTIYNAKLILDLDREHKGFRNYLRSKSSYQELSADIRKRFKFVGELSAYYFLFRVNEKVPPFEEWIVNIPGDHPRMKEMIELARKTDPTAAR